MESIVIEVSKYYCRPSVFTINGVDADLDDFGNGGDTEPLPEVDEDDDGWRESRYCCGNYKWRRNRPADNILEKYDITLREYNDICNTLEDKLSKELQNN